MPNWALMLEAANYDPLRAQEIYTNISALWWERWMINRAARIDGEKYRQDRAAAKRKR